MIYSGFCDKQNKHYSVKFVPISVSALDDQSKQFRNGRLECGYAGTTGCFKKSRQVIRNGRFSEIRESTLLKILSAMANL